LTGGGTENGRDDECHAARIKKNVFWLLLSYYNLKYELYAKTLPHKLKFNNFGKKIITKEELRGKENTKTKFLCYKRRAKNVTGKKL
jgi:hypothetical protein